MPARRIQLDLSLAQVIGGSLAALYTQSLHRTRTHAQAAAALIAARRKGTDERPAAVGPPARAVLRPRRLIAAVLIVFGLAVAAITGFELLSGHPLSGGTAGTTLGELTGNGSAADSGGASRDRRTSSRAWILTPPEAARPRRRSRPSRRRARPAPNPARRLRRPPRTRHPARRRPPGATRPADPSSASGHDLRSVP
ncbi:MAG: hypothetical protein ACR2J5_08040 [Geodermatophilaceae bacterium]